MLLTEKDQQNGHTLSEEEFMYKVRDRLTASGEKEQLLQWLRPKLVETGWRSQMEKVCQEIMEEKGGDITRDELMSLASKDPRAVVSEEVRSEVKRKLDEFVKKMQEEDD